MLITQSYLCPRKDFSNEAFFDYWRNRHAPLASKMPGLISYRIAFLNGETPMLSPDGHPVLGFAELRFPDVDARNGAYASDAGTRAADDLRNFAREVMRFEVCEHVVIENLIRNR